MKKLGFLIAGVSLLMSGALFASVRPCPGEFSFTAEWIYLDPIVDNPYYVINSEEDDDVKGPRKANELDFESGFRLEAMYAFCDCATDFRFAWTHLNTDHKDRVKVRGEDERFLLPTVGHPEEMDEDYDFAASRIKFDFDRVEALFGYRFMTCGCLDIALEGGLQYARFDTQHRNEFRIPGSGSSLQGEEDEFIKYAADSCYWGIGPQIGIDLNYCLCGNFSLVATANWALLVGENETKTLIFEQEGDEIEIEVFSKNDCIYRIVPATHIRAGLNYGFGCGCWDFNIEAGYQFYSYQRALDTIEFVSDKGGREEGQVGRSLDIYSNADMHGPYVSVTFNF
ncbi:MAG: hypothetical protein K940chlam9_00792 [Chlamydiae bacterium]|nr:hypothetical protein [Chlamydiota bacterium]